MMGDSEIQSRADAFLFDWIDAEDEESQKRVLLELKEWLGREPSHQLDWDFTVGVAEAARRYFKAEAAEAQQRGGKEV